MAPKNEEELTVALELLESVLEGTSDAILILDKNEDIIRINQSFEQMFGWSVRELQENELKTRIIIPSEHEKEVDGIIHHLKSGGSLPIHNTQRLRKSAEKIDVSISYSSIKDLEGEVIGFVLIYRDITRQKKVERALRESEAKYRVIAEHSTDLMVVLDTKGRVLYASPSHYYVLGFEVQYVHKHMLSHIHQEDIDRFIDTYKSAVIEKKSFKIDVRIKHANGNWIDIEMSGVPVINEKDEIESIVMIGRDMTKKKQAEEMMRKSEKLSVLGELAAGVAHEIRNPLTSLKGFAQLLKEAKDEMKMEYIDIMLSELDRINDIVGELMLVAKPQAVQYEYRNFNELLYSVVRLLDTQAIMKNIQIKCDIDSNLPPVYCVGNQMKQLFINLLKNSIEAMDNGGLIQLTAFYQNGNVRAILEDEGGGIPKDRLTTLGEPFYTTKEKGTGLGLMVCFSIVKEHRGSIQFFSEEGRGTRVEIQLPISVDDRLT
ncbi:PAS domain S-box protein [Fictibacillus sp. Mic-4]|uniref:PAS domain-containing sensor histidine kinase n=1 Tax=Fictibacillus sp. Mic-4 TaxID=3132826 RepID=UPI003CF73317